MGDGIFNSRFLAVLGMTRGQSHKFPVAAWLRSSSSGFLVGIVPRCGTAASLGMTVGDGNRQRGTGILEKQISRCARNGNGEPCRENSLIPIKLLRHGFHHYRRRRFFAKLSFPACDDRSGKAITQNVRGRAGHVHELIDSHDDQDRPCGKMK
jgi:hypothetical protein